MLVDGAPEIPILIVAEVLARGDVLKTHLALLFGTNPVNGAVTAGTSKLTLPLSNVITSPVMAASSADDEGGAGPRDGGVDRLGLRAIR
jgi:hypothetical protein